jgi:L-histidine Nalpha-methyltransferase
MRDFAVCAALRRELEMLTQSIVTSPAYEFAADVRAGLTKPGQKELLSKYLYDEVGSALFEVISFLPEYGLTRADERLLRRHARDIVELLPTPVAVAELGSGSGKKTRWILEALCRRQRTSYYPIEISRTALAMCARELGDIDSISIVGFEREYLDGLLEAAAQRRPCQHLLILFLGSTIGNFDRPAGINFLREVRRILEPGDAMLLGTDLEKSSAQLIGAYDDNLGVTAAFNLNLLARINRELDADFELSQFEHVARIDRETRRVEMHLRSKRRQTVNIPGSELLVEFLEGETIWTESSHKYSAEEVFQIGRDAGFRCQAQWIDDEWPFAESLLVAE